LQQCNCFEVVLVRNTQVVRMTGDARFKEGHTCFYRQPPMPHRLRRVYGATLEDLFLALCIVLLISPLYMRFCLLQANTRQLD
jgi:hypothetical protein